MGKETKKKAVRRPILIGVRGGPERLQHEKKARASGQKKGTRQDRV